MKVICCFFTKKYPYKLINKSESIYFLKYISKCYACYYVVFSTSLLLVNGDKCVTLMLERIMYLLGMENNLEEVS